MAKKVAGTGTIRSDGSVGDTGATGAKGADGTDGTAGTPGVAGNKGADDLAVLLDSYYAGGSPATFGYAGEVERCETQPATWHWVDLSTGNEVTPETTDSVPGQYFAFTNTERGIPYEVICTMVPRYYHIPEVPATLVQVWQDGQSSNYYGGAAGAAGAAGTKGLGGAGGAGGTGETGTTGGEGSVFLITDSDDVPAEMMVGTYKTTIVNA
jgi:hypothetical protein